VGLYKVLSDSSPEVHTKVLDVAGTKVPEVSIRDYAESPNNLIPMYPTLCTIDLTAKAICERLVLVLGQRSFAHTLTTPSAPTPPPVKQTTYQNLWPRINWSIKIAHSAVSKPVCSAVSFLRRQPQIFENVTLVARRRKYFRGFGADFLLLNILQKGGVLIHKNSLASCQLVSSQRRTTLWRVLSNKVIRVFAHFWVDIPHIHDVRCF